jgi:hypothetical protein
VFPVRRKDRKRSEQFFHVGAYGVLIVYIKRRRVPLGQIFKLCFCQGKSFDVHGLLYPDRREKGKAATAEHQGIGFYSFSHFFILFLVQLKQNDESNPYI